MDSAALELQAFGGVQRAVLSFFFPQGACCGALQGHRWVRKVLSCAAANPLAWAMSCCSSVLDRQLFAMVRDLDFVSMGA